MRAPKLSEEDIVALIVMVGVYGEPKIMPEEKMEQALAAVDEEAELWRSHSM
jgi:hypothetical protein